MRYKIEDNKSVQELTVYDLKLYGHYDEHVLGNSIFSMGLNCEFGQEYFEIVVPKKLLNWQKIRLKELFQRYDFDGSIFEKLEGLNDDSQV